MDKTKVQKYFKISGNTVFLNEKKQVAIKQQLIGINKLVKSFEQKFDDIEVQTSKLGQKLNKEFIEDNIANENYFQLEQEIYNFYEEMKARKFYPIFKIESVCPALDNELMVIKKDLIRKYIY